MQHNASDAPSEALLLLLQHQEIVSQNNSPVIKLLAASNALRSAIAVTSAGRLSIAYTNRDPNEKSYYTNLSRSSARDKSFLVWLSKHGHLLGSLHIKDTSLAFDNNLAAALRAAAAASPNGLQLRSYDSAWDDNNSVKVLRELPVNHLTHLRMCVTEPMPDLDDMGFSSIPVYEDDDEFEMEMAIHSMQVANRQHIVTKHDNTEMLAALTAFSSLSSLTIHGYETLDINSPLMRGMSALTSLTRLQVDDVLPTHNLLSHLPAQLQELEVNGTDRNPSTSKPLDLGHLTALTRLHLSANGSGWGGKEVYIGGADVLPPNLVSLCVSKVEGPLQLLVDLKSLRKLTLVKLPLLSQLPGGGATLSSAQAAAAAATGTSTSGGRSKAARTQPSGSSNNQAAAELEQLQACLPNVAITVASAATFRQFKCHCN